MAFNETKNMKVCGIILLKSGPRFQKLPRCYSNLHHSPRSTSSIVRLIVAWWVFL